jgi:hypothetical protein
VTAGGAVGAARGAARGAGGAVHDATMGVTCGAVVVPARGRSPGGTVEAGRGATGGSKPGGIFGAVR